MTGKGYLIINLISHLIIGRLYSWFTYMQTPFILMKVVITVIIMDRMMMKDEKITEIEGEIIIDVYQD